MSTVTTATADRDDRSAGGGRPATDGSGGERRRWLGGGGIRGNERIAGWIFVAPVIVLLGIFFLAPIIMAFWVSLNDWQGPGSPLKSGGPFVGGDNYTRLFTEDGLARRDFMTSLRNNMYYVAIVVPIQ